MRPSHHIRLAILGVASLTLLGSCGRSDDGTLHIAVIGDPGSLFESGSRLSQAAQLVRGATAEGLVGFDAKGRVIPALADQWIVTDDGMSYIFRLRDGTWPDGTAITGEAARTALREAISALRGTPMALDLSDIAEVRTMAGRVIELRLKSPMPDLLQVLAQPELGLLYNNKGSGPLELHRQGSAAILRPIPPQKRGLPKVEDWEETARSLVLRADDGAAAIRRFDKGEVDVVLGGRIDTFPLTGVAGLSRGTIRLDPVFGLFGLSAAHLDGFLSVRENREAIAMAIDRDKLLDEFSLGGWTPSNRIVSPGVEGDLGTIGERWAGLSIDARQQVARTRVTRWRQTGHPDIRLRIALPPGKGSDLLYRRIATDLSAIGLTPTRVGRNAPADLRLVDVAAHYPRATWFLNQLSCAAQRGACSAQADARAAEADEATDPAQRSALLAEAEAEMTSANIFIPFGAPVRWSLVRGDISGFSENRWGYHPLQPFTVIPR